MHFNHQTNSGCTMEGKEVNYKPLGARLLVDPIITTVTLEERAKQAGLELVLEHENIPRPTQGRVIALGSDPFLHEQIKVGDIVMFHHLSGHDVTLTGITYRQLELTDITGVLQDDEPTTSA